MVPLSKVNWGPDDAKANDPDFAQKWVEPQEIQICLDESKWIVSGEKGSGKSAIARALQEIHPNRFDATKTVDFNDITFSALYKNISEFSKTTQLDRTLTLSQYWQFSLVIELIIICAEKLPAHYGGFGGRVASLGRSTTLPQRLLALVESAWNMLDDLTGLRGKQPTEARRFTNLLETSGITAEELTELGRFPLSEEFLKLKSDFFKAVSANGHRTLVMLDGLDKIDNTDINPQSVGLIFSSLVDAIITLKNDRDMPQSIFF